MGDWWAECEQTKGCCSSQLSALTNCVQPSDPTASLSTTYGLDAPELILIRFPGDGPWEEGPFVSWNCHKNVLQTGGQNYRNVLSHDSGD